MSYIEIDGEEQFTDDNDTSITITPQVDETATVRCALCGETDADGPRTGQSTCTESSIMCQACDENDPECVICDGTGNGPHTDFPIALGWFNHAGVSISEEGDRVKLHISIGDPRGALVVEVGRSHDGRILMHLPTESHHVRSITEIHAGTYEITV